MYKRLLTTLLIILTPIVLLLLAYFLVLGLTPMTIEQTQTIDFVQKGSELQLNYTAKEYSHLEDVQDVMKGVKIVFIVGLLLLFGLVVYSWKDRKRLLKYGGVSTVVFVGVVLMFSLVAFKYTFTFFHQIFFPQGNWQFAVDSLLIQTFPLEFFISISRNIFLLTLGLGILFIVISYLLKHDHKSKRS